MVLDLVRLTDSPAQPLVVLVVIVFTNRFKVRSFDWRDQRQSLLMPFFLSFTSVSRRVVILVSSTEEV